VPASNDFFHCQEGEEEEGEDEFDTSPEPEYKHINKHTSDLQYSNVSKAK